MEKTKFDDWSDVKDCNDCQHYWNSTCDSPPNGSEKRCTAFLATRKVNTQAEIDSLRKALKWLIVSQVCLLIALVSSIIGGLL